MKSKDELHRLIDELPDALTGEVLDFVQSLLQKELRRARDGGLAALRAAPIDDEPDTVWERSESAESWADYKLNGGISALEARQHLL